jgi:hypothetical protein
MCGDLCIPLDVLVFPLRQTRLYDGIEKLMNTVLFLSRAISNIVVDLTSTGLSPGDITYPRFVNAGFDVCKGAEDFAFVLGGWIDYISDKLLGSLLPTSFTNVRSSSYTCAISSGVCAAGFGVGTIIDALINLRRILDWNSDTSVFTTHDQYVANTLRPNLLRVVNIVAAGTTVFDIGPQYFQFQGVPNYDFTRYMPLVDTGASARVDACLYTAIQTIGAPIIAAGIDIRKVVNILPALSNIVLLRC